MTIVTLSLVELLITNHYQLTHHCKLTILYLLYEFHPTNLHDSIVIGDKCHEFASDHTCDLTMGIISRKLDLNDCLFSFFDFIELSDYASLASSSSSSTSSFRSSFIICASISYFIEILDTDTHAQVFFYLLYTGSRFADYFWFHMGRDIDDDSI